MVVVSLSPDDLALLEEALHALEYWEYATELDLPRRNGQVFLPEDDPTSWQRTRIGADELNALAQIRRARSLRQRILGGR